MAPSSKLLGECYSLDYPCVMRFRHRRLITYLWLNRFSDACCALVRETGRVYLNVSHLDREAATTVAKRPDHLILDVDNKALDHPATKLRSIFLQLYSSHQLRASLDWVKVRSKAAKIVRDLVYKCRPLRDLTLLPACSMWPKDILPIGFGHRPRRHVKKQGRAHVPLSHLARIYLEKKNGVSSSSHHQESGDAGSSIENEKLLLSLIEESLRAGSHPQLRTAHPTQFLFKEGPPVLQKAGTSTGKSSGISSLTNAGAPNAPVLQKIDTTAAKKYGISSLKNAGK